MPKLETAERLNKKPLPPPFFPSSQIFISSISLFSEYPVTSPMASSSSSDAMMSSSSSPDHMPSGTVIDAESKLSSPNPSPSPVAAESNSDAEMTSSASNLSGSVLDVENRLSSSPMPSNANHYPTPPGPISYGNQTPPTASQILEAFQPSYCPPPPPYYPPPPSDFYEGRNKYCKRRLALIIFMLIVYAMIITAFVNLYYKPKYPTVSLTSVTVSSFTTSSKSSTISSDITLTVTLKNPNEGMDITYGGLASHVLYHDDFIARNDYPRFVHNAGETISKAIRLVEEESDVDADTIEAIDGDVANNHGVVKFEVKMAALMSFSKIHWIPELLAVYCPDVNIQFENGTRKGAMVGPAITCKSLDF